MRFPALRIFVSLFVVACATTARRPAASGTARTQQNTPGCLDTLHTVDTAQTIIAVSVGSADTSIKLPQGFSDLFSEEFRSRFKAPGKLALSVVMGSEPCDSLGLRCAGGELSVESTAYVTAYNNGKLSEPEVIDAALTPALADSVRSALNAISRDDEVPWLGRIDSIPLVVTLAPIADSDGVNHFSAVFRARVPVYDAPFAYAAMPRAGVDARYPFQATIAGVGDTVTLAFTVRADGTIAPESIEIMEASYREFVSAVLDALSKTRYHPARLGDCAVATRLKQRFVFKSAP